MQGTACFVHPGSYRCWLSAVLPSTAWAPSTAAVQSGAVPSMQPFTACTLDLFAQHALKMHRLRRMAQDAGPAKFFHFSPTAADPCAGFVRRAAVPLTLQNWTFSTWLRLDNPHATSKSVAGAPLLALFSTDPDSATTAPGAAPAGVAIVVRDGRLTVVAVGGNSSKVARGAACPLSARKWHHVAVTVETVGALVAQPSAVCVYLNGQRMGKGSVRIAHTSAVHFLSVAMPLALPAADWRAPLEALCGQMASAHLFSQCLPAAKVRSLCAVVVWCPLHLSSAVWHRLSALCFSVCRGRCALTSSNVLQMNAALGTLVCQISGQQQRCSPTAQLCRCAFVRSEGALAIAAQVLGKALLGYLRLFVLPAPISLP